MFGELVIPILYRLDPSHVRKQTGDFGKIFEKTCQYKTEVGKIRWRGAMTNVANILGYYIVTWYDFNIITLLFNKHVCEWVFFLIRGNEASTIEEIANDVWVNGIDLHQLILRTLSELKIISQR